MVDSTVIEQCVRGDEVGAFLDGELTVEDERVFEEHLRTCAKCSAELRDQKGLLRTLDFAFAIDRSIDLPDGFSNAVALRAESDLSGFRSWSANGRALRLFVAIGIGVLLLLGIGGREGGTASARNVLLAILGLLDLLSRFVYDLVLGLVVVVRGVGGSLVNSPSPFGALSLALFCGAAICLVRQLIRFHRG
ncbi:MAG: zf-HC2 domain-containing protein [Pyrinomonadaceae bacterium]